MNWFSFVCLLLSAGLSASQELIEATKNGDIEQVKKLFGDFVNQKDRRGYTSLMYAAENGDKDLVLLLLKYGASVNERSNEGFTFTSLMLAAKGGSSEIVNILLEHGADIDQRSNNGRTSLIYASLLGKEGVVKILLENAANIEEKDYFGVNSVTYAARNGHADVVETLLFGCDPNDSVSAKKRRRMTSLMYAVRSGNQEVVEFLLKIGSDVNAKNDYDTTSLIYAAKYGYPEIVQMLLDYGAFINVENRGGETPLNQAYNCLQDKQTCAEVVDVLIAHGKPECKSYSILNEEDRSVTEGVGKNCDNTEDLKRVSAVTSPQWKESGWYRFKFPAGLKLAQSSPGRLHCGSVAAGWSNSTLPDTAGDSSYINICFHGINTTGGPSLPCNFANQGKVTNCGSFFVYYLLNTPQCILRYCGSI